MGGKWWLRDWTSPERTVVGTLTKLYNTGSVIGGNDSDTNVQIRVNDSGQGLLRNRHDRPNADQGIIECEVNVIEDGRDQYEDWVRSMLGQEVTAKGVWVDDDGHESKTELHPMDLILMGVDGSLIPGDWMGRLARELGLQLGTSMLAYRFAAASDDREGVVLSGPPLAEWDRPTIFPLALPPVPTVGMGWAPKAALQISSSAHATVDLPPGRHGGVDVINLTITCRGRDYGGPGYAIGEVVTYWVSPAQLAYLPDKLQFGLIGIGEAVVRTLRIINSSISPITVTVLPSRAGSPFAWTTPPPTVLIATASMEVQVEFSPLAAGRAESVLTVESNAQGSPHRIPLTGSGRRGTPN